MSLPDQSLKISARHYPEVRISVERSATFGKKAPAIYETADGAEGLALLSEAVMQKIEDLYGDGTAQVSVGMDMARKEFGAGFGVTVHLSAKCEGTTDVMRAMHELLKEETQGLLVSQWEEAAGLYESLTGGR